MAHSLTRWSACVCVCVSQMNYFAELRVGTNCFVLGAARQFIVWTVSFWTIVLTYNLYDSVMTLRCSNQQPATRNVPPQRQLCSVVILSHPLQRKHHV